MSAIPTFWWSPRRAPRTLAVELRDRGPAWARCTTSLRRAFTNHGDELNAVVIPELTGRPVEWAPIDRAEVVAIGSVLVPYLAAGGRGHVLGSGDGTGTLTAADGARIADRVLALRGPLTRDALAVAPDVPLGDPGLAVRSLARRADRRSGALAIPHFQEFGAPSHRRALRAVRAAGFEVAGPTTAPLDMIDRIARADFVASSSLHGVIIAQALGTPVQYVAFGEGTPIPGHKFRDHARAVGAAETCASWRGLVDPAERRRLQDDAADESSRIGARIDQLVEGLFRAAAPLRSA